LERTPLDFFPGQCVTPRLFDDNDRGLEIILVEGKDKKDRASPTRYRTPNCLMFVKTTAIAYGQKIDRSLRILVVCNTSRSYKRQAIGSIVTPMISTRTLSGPKDNK